MGIRTQFERGRAPACVMRLVVVLLAAAGLTAIAASGRAETLGPAGGDGG